MLRMFTPAPYIHTEIMRLRPALFGERPELFQPIDDNLARSNWTFTMHPGAVDRPSRCWNFQRANVVESAFLGTERIP